MYRQRKIPIFVYSISTLVIILITIATIVIAFFEILIDIDTKGTCESNGLASIKSRLYDYAKQHNGLISLDEVKNIIQKTHPEYLICNYAKEPYIWRNGKYNIYTTPAQPIVFCPKPHGIIKKFRVVLFSNLELKRIPENEFRLLFHEKY